ncbi:uncharacterized protein PRCAT00002481001 [Priceomyces carsonii]|uniref:uncharacterized protein n=1 Tax=Priceomyces carsonii TaxID=28549 RepID=UPI002ED85F31|nr:unnamed protein product [Priceomyces carsonii]
MKDKPKAELEESHYYFPREFKGYGESPPNFNWPHNPKIIVNFVVNYEEGAEMTIENKDSSSEQYIWELPYVPHHGVRSYDCESDFEYGSRVGIWRLLRAFKKYNWKFTTFGVGKAFELMPEVAQALESQGHEISSHCYRWYDYSKLSIEEEKDLIYKNMNCFKRIFGRYPKGWYYARLSQHSYRLVYDVYQELGADLLWMGDSYCDDLPYYKPVPKTEDALLMIPYSYDNNDARFHMPTGWSSSDDFFIHLKNSFDCLYEEGKDLGVPKMMTVALHARVITKPGRMPALMKFMQYVKEREDEVWVATREEIANHFKKVNPYK